MRRTSITLFAIVLAGLVAVPLSATDLDEQYRPLPAQGQTMWDVGLSVQDYWSRMGYSGSAQYYGYLFAVPTVSLDAGLTDKLRLSVAGSYADYSLAEGSRTAGSSGSVALTYRFTPGLQLAFSYAEVNGHGSSGNWSPVDPTYAYQGGGENHGKSAALSVSWLSRPSRSYTLLVSDLNGLTAPLMDPGQSLLEGSLSMSRQRYSDWTDYHQGGQHSSSQYWSDGDDAWYLQAGWRIGLAQGWEGALNYSHTFPYEQVATSQYQGNPWMPPLVRTAYAYSDMDSLSAEVRRRWGQTLQISGGMGYGQSTQTSTQNDVHSFAENRGRSWGAHVTAIAVSRPTRAGRPVTRDLEGFTSPLLDRGQVRWDGRLDWMRSRYRLVDKRTGATLAEATSFPSWMLRNSVTLGLTEDVQFQGTFNITPYFNPSPFPDEWSHWTAGAALTYRPKPSVELRASYDLRYDYSGGASKQMQQVLRLGATVVW